MEENFKNIIKQAVFEPNPNLKERIWQKIIKRNKNIAIFKLISFSFIGITSLFSFVPVFKILISDFSQSGFYEYLSLAFSKDGFFSSYSKDFAFSIMESLPLNSILFTLSLIFIFFLSLRFIIKQITQLNSRLDGKLSFNY